MDKAVDLLWQFGFFFGGTVTGLGAAIACVILTIYVIGVIENRRMRTARFATEMFGIFLLMMISTFASIHLFQAVKF